MVGNAVLFAFCVMIARLLFRLKLKKCTDRKVIRQSLWILVVVLVFLSFNALMAIAEYSRVHLLKKLDPILYESVLQETGNAEPVIVIGVVSNNNSALSGNYIAYMDDQNLWSRKGIIIDLKRGHAVIANDTFSVIDWPVDASGNSYLQAGQAVTVFGHAGHFKTIAGPDSGHEFVNVKATDVFAGTVDDYIRHKSVYKYSFLVLLVFNIGGIIYVLSLMIFSFRTIRRAFSAA